MWPGVPRLGLLLNGSAGRCSFSSCTQTSLSCCSSSCWLEGPVIPPQFPGIQGAPLPTWWPSLFLSFLPECTSKSVCSLRDFGELEAAWFSRVSLALALPSSWITVFPYPSSNPLFMHRVFLREGMKVGFLPSKSGEGSTGRRQCPGKLGPSLPLAAPSSSCAATDK